MFIENFLSNKTQCQHAEYDQEYRDYLNGGKWRGRKCMGAINHRVPTK